VRLCGEVLRQPGLATDPRFSSNVQRVANRPALDALVAAVFAEEAREALAERLFAAGIAFGRLNTVADFSQHPHLRRLDVPTPEGAVSMPAPPVRHDGADLRPRAIPGIGEHSERIRRELGL
jgi:crotonobetainyl-CoA:carnitine CoA-transferase CaiB-like acyl-CoA transferase